MKLGEEAIIRLQSTSKDEALLEMSALAARLVQQVDEDQVYNALMKREKIGSTGIGGGVAIPHAKVVGVQGKLLALGYSDRGVPYDSVDRRPAEVLVLLLGEPGPNLEYLRALGKLGRMLRDESNLELLLNARNPSQLDTVFSRLLHSAILLEPPHIHVNGEPAPYIP
ncbi:MAG: PTS sugar transporter subunit IIA [Desulfobulbaceae bacterium]|nr:PTS sugar transporter subunit IIA [Desulfobulbaceae bacterium]